MKNRLGIYFFYDKEGFVGDYVTYYLQHIKPFCSELCVVVNSPLSEEGKIKLEKVSDKLIVRENVGYDSQAYKHAMLSYGYNKIKEYDELLLCNFTCYGPIYPFDEMFSEMDKRNCDFWGIGWYPRVNNKKVCKKQTTDYVPEHIMSFFMVIRNKMLSSECFEQYWANIKVPTTYNEAVAFNELIFTDYFVEKGFKGDTYISKSITNKFCENIFAFAPMYALKERCPLVKRNIFKADYFLINEFGRGDQAINTLNYIKENTNYDINMIYDDLLKTQKGSHIKRVLHLNYFLDENNHTVNVNELKDKQKTAMLCYCYYNDMLNYCYNYAKNLPEWVDIYLFVVDENLVNNAKKIFGQLPNKFEVRVKENRGQLASTVLISGKDIFKKYDLVCVTQAKKSSQLRDNFASENFCDHCWEGVLKSKSYVLNLLQTFYDNPRMGYSCNFLPHSGDFSTLCGNEVGINQNNMLNLMKMLDINVPFDDEPIASYGECYWVRSKGFKKVLAYDWKHSDFPEAAKTPKDGCILNALERLMPIFVQEQGFYPAWIIPISYASIYFDNIYYKYRNICKRPIYVKSSPFIAFKKVFYKLLSCVTFGDRKKKYKEKSKRYKLYRAK
ncbi:MAG: hypothetical protein IKC10_03460 [Alphaproteobacteria bacterium]|nr:hypothetical protein [Alphaproteobacteria bacterium]